MSLAHAPKTTCPRCLELRPAEIHTCTPTEAWWELESERDRYRQALEKIKPEVAHAIQEDAGVFMRMTKEQAYAWGIARHNQLHGAILDTIDGALNPQEPR
jgi:hypothetical protein